MAQKFYEKASVQVAIVAGIFSLLYCGITIWNDRSQLKQDNQNYVRELIQKDSRIASLEREIQRLEIQLVPLKIVSLEGQSFIFNVAKISQLGDLSSWHNKYGGQRQSYEELLSWGKKENSSEIKKKISVETERLEEIYDPRIMIPTIEQPISICKFITQPNIPACAWGLEPPTGYDAKNVFHHLTERIWTERARAACLLRNIRTSQYKDQIDKEKLFDTLVSLMKEENEKSLFVSKMALNTYSELTGFSPSGVFDFDGAINDWKSMERKKEILKINF
ncbi:MAG: hypothetical protein Q7K71_04460 [Candidatus Omnitrophota bacterium]|nr:hypothetical protein [Candidatus Omnitrophota bacterium]